MEPEDLSLARCDAQCKTFASRHAAEASFWKQRGMSCCNNSNSRIH
jgi:hypothetical protein